jgi:hypothetical protein
MKLHMMKLAVGIEDLDEFWRVQQREIVDYEGEKANICRTRFKPKQADQILQTGGSLYRVMKKRILCRQKILGFEEGESKEKGKQCLIMLSTDIIQTYATPKRPFQGWRYLDPKQAPADRGLYLGDGQRGEIPQDLEDALIQSGLL